MAKPQWRPMDESENHIERLDIVKLCQEEQWQYININKVKRTKHLSMNQHYSSIKQC